jgi:hypothetical protein
MESQAQSNDLRDILSKKADINMVNDNGNGNGNGNGKCNVKSNDTNNDTDTDVEKEKEKYVPSENMKHLMQMMDDESKDIVNKSWSKINRSNKLILLEEFVEREIIDKELNENQGKNLKILLTKTLNSNLLNKQSDIKYDSVKNTILEITILKYNVDTETYEIVTKKNSVKVNTKPRSKTNIDKLLNNSKKRR